jgi:hypothetical protein
VLTGQPFIVDVIVPVLEHGENLSFVLAALPRELLRRVVVVRSGNHNGAAAPEVDGATVLAASGGGFGAAVQRGLQYLQELESAPNAVIVMAGDGSDDPTDVPALLRPLMKGGYDLVIGSHMIGPGHGATMNRVSRYGNLLAVGLIRLLYGYSYSDLSTFIAIRFPALVALSVQEAGAGFAAELRVKALKIGLRVAEIPVAHRRRRGTEESAESLRQQLDAGYKSLFQILRNSTTR